MFKTLSKEFVAARAAVDAVSDPAEAALIHSLAKQRELQLQCDQFQAQQAAGESAPTTREEVLNFVVQTDGVEKLEELASAIGEIGEIGPSEHDQAMELLELMLDHGGCPDSGKALCSFVLEHYAHCRGAVADCNAAD